MWMCSVPPMNDSYQKHVCVDSNNIVYAGGTSYQSSKSLYAIDSGGSIIAEQDVYIENKRVDAVLGFRNILTPLGDGIIFTAMLANGGGYRVASVNSGLSVNWSLALSGYQGNQRTNYAYSAMLIGGVQYLVEVNASGDIARSWAYSADTYPMYPEGSIYVSAVNGYTAAVRNFDATLSLSRSIVTNGIMSLGGASVAPYLFDNVLYARGTILGKWSGTGGGPDWLFSLLPGEAINNVVPYLDGSLIVAGSRKVYRIAASTAEVIWSAAFAATSLCVSPNGNIICSGKVA
jgi:hypothetical protein